VKEGVNYETASLTSNPIMHKLLRNEYGKNFIGVPFSIKSIPLCPHRGVLSKWQVIYTSTTSINRNPLGRLMGIGRGDGRGRHTMRDSMKMSDFLINRFRLPVKLDTNVSTKEDGI
jgi:hypothetical protein